MQIINSGRGSGKTYSLVQWLREDPNSRIIITSSRLRADQILQQYGLRKDQVVSVSTWANYYLSHGATGKQIALDGLDAILDNILGIVPEIVTTTADIRRTDAQSEGKLGHGENFFERASEPDEQPGGEEVPTGPAKPDISDIADATVGFIHLLKDFLK